MSQSYRFGSSMNNQQFEANNFYYFGWNKGVRFSKTLFRYNLTTNTLTRVTHFNNKFRGFIVIQVDQNLFALSVGYPIGCYEYSNLGTDNITKTQRANPLCARTN